ncbi:MAG: 16S rRNA (adenine(1518)-N(6)/adenine(1519)-N(6))-dimethyltransferase RsmA [Patescibacteria group bacterium]
MIAKKSFGQHFLHDMSVVKKIIIAAGIKPGEMVLEVGPGHGVLTTALVDAQAEVIAVEADRDLISELKEKFGNKIELICQDILKFDTEQLGRYKLVANLPYNIASAVIEKFLSAKRSPTRMVIMVQKEVAERILAKPGEMSVLSVACQLYADIKRVTNVAPGAFNPPPKVDSTVIQMDLKTKGEDNEQIIALAKAGFRSRRKQLHKNLAEANIAQPERTKAALQAMNLPETARAQELSIDQWIKLYDTL